MSLARMSPGLKRDGAGADKATRASAAMRGRTGVAVIVLIVDDSAVMRKVVARTLAQAGLAMTQVLEAANGQDALELLRTRAADQATVQLMLVDIHMPVMGGLEFLEQMRAEALMQHVPVAIITTEASEAHVRRALAAGAAAYLRKPFTSDQIKAAVMRLVTTL